MLGRIWFILVDGIRACCKLKKWRMLLSASCNSRDVNPQVVLVTLSFYIYIYLTLPYLWLWLCYLFTECHAVILCAVLMMVDCKGKTVCCCSCNTSMMNKQSTCRCLTWSANWCPAIFSHLCTVLNNWRELVRSRDLLRFLYSIYTVSTKNGSSFYFSNNSVKN